MTKSGMLGLRVPQEVFDRADALIPALSHLASGRASGTLVRSEVLRLALLRGLEALEQEALAGDDPGRKRARKR